MKIYKILPGVRELNPMFCTERANGLRLRTGPSGRGAGAGVDSAWEQRKLEAKKLLENVADSRKSTAYHPGARAGRFVGRFFGQPCSAFCKTIVFQKQHIKSVDFFN